VELRFLPDLQHVNRNLRLTWDRNHDRTGTGPRDNFIQRRYHRPGMPLLCSPPGLLAPIRRSTGAYCLLVALGLELSGCGDGIGRPIRSEPAGAGQSNAGTTQGVDSMSSGGTTQGKETAPSAGMNQGFDSATSGGAATSGAETAPIEDPSFQGNGQGGRGPGGPPGGPLAACREAQSWPPEQVAAEDSLLSVLNAARQSGNVTCGAGTAAVVAPTLAVSDQLRCFARTHSNYMLSKGALTSFGVEGGPPSRIGQSGGEVIATSEATNVNTAGLLQKLVSSRGTDCVNLMDSRFDSVGVGFAADSSVGYWTIELATQ
jgi:uncharacterized protein YkwD